MAIWVSVISQMISYLSNSITATATKTTNLFKVFHPSQLLNSIKIYSMGSRIINLDLPNKWMPTSIQIARINSKFFRANSVRNLQLFVPRATNLSTLKNPIPFTDHLPFPRRHMVKRGIWALKPLDAMMNFLSVVCAIETPSQY